MVFPLLRRVVPFALAVALALTVSTPVAAVDPAPASGTSGQCALVTVVSSDSDEARADVYVAKDTPYPTPTDEPTLEEVVDYVEEVVAYALGYATTTHPVSNSADVQVELVFPANSDAGTEGVRVSFVVDLSNCSLS